MKRPHRIARLAVALASLAVAGTLIPAASFGAPAAPTPIGPDDGASFAYDQQSTLTFTSRRGGGYPHIATSASPETVADGRFKNPLSTDPTRPSQADPSIDSLTLQQGAYWKQAGTYYWQPLDQYDCGSGSTNPCWVAGPVRSFTLTPPASAPPPAVSPVSPVADSAVRWTRGRLTFAWTDPNGGSWAYGVSQPLPTVEVFNGDPKAGGELVAAAPALLDYQYDDENIPRQQGVAKALLPSLEIGEYWWRLRTDDSPRASDTFHFKVVPPNLSQLRVRLHNSWGQSKRRPGATLVSVAATPWASISMTAIRQGKVVQRVNWVPGYVGDSAVYRWSCGVAGPTTFRVVARDEVGHQITRTAKTRVPTCREVTARERRSQSRFDVQERAFKRACAKKGGKVRIADGQERCVTPAKVIIIVLVLP